MDSVSDESRVRRKVRCHTVAVDFFVELTGLGVPSRKQIPPVSLRSRVGMINVSGIPASFLRFTNCDP